MEGAGVDCPPRSSPSKNPEFFYFSQMIKFANFEFILAIRGPKFARRHIEGKLMKFKIGGLFFYMHP